MSRWRKLLVVLTVVTLWFANEWNDKLPIPPLPEGVHAASAQPPPYTYGLNSQGLLQYTTASVTAANTTAETLLWQSTIPGGLTATSPNANWIPSGVATPPPLHLHLEGVLSTNVATGGVGTINVGVNYGGGVTGVASIALVNAWAPQQNLSLVPLRIDVCVSPIATASQTAGVQGSVGAVYLVGHMAHAAAAAAAGQVAAATETVFNAQALGTTGGGFLASNEQINVLWKWASASNTNSVTIYNGQLMLGCRF